MLITYHGHSQFALEFSNGYTLITDPFDAHVGYAMEAHACQAVTVSHSHGDHNCVEKLSGKPVVVDRAGVHALAPDVRVTAIPSVHDDAGGAKRGQNLIMKIQADGLTLLHLGDQGDLLTPAQLQQIGKTDILFIPIGGFYTIDAAAARRIVEDLQPRVVIPMHYKTAVNADWPITDEKPFLQKMGKPNLAPMPLLRITKGDLAQQPSLALLQIR